MNLDIASFIVTIQITRLLSVAGVKSAHIQVYAARFFLGSKQNAGNLNSYTASVMGAE